MSALGRLGRARLGGDEFVILLEQTTQASDALVISERIQQSLQEPIELDGHNVVTSASIGIVFGDLRYQTPEDILRDADIAMYHAKMLGKACHTIFKPSMRKRAMVRMGLENDLRDALEDPKRMSKELDVVFQPIVNLHNERIVGFEALLRWEHPERGPIPPNEFIPVAEETGLIHLLGLWVLRRACHQVRKWQTDFPETLGSSPISMNVNISGIQFSRPNLADEIYKIVEEFDIPPTSLNLEITESLLMETKTTFYDLLAKIRSLGINLQVDDFGRGYASYGYLQSLPISSLKIDSAFIHRLGIEGNNSEIVRSIVDLARSLGMSVIAEGVETEAQFDQLRELECPFVQGYYISEPVSGQKAGQLLLENWQDDLVMNPI